MPTTHSFLLDSKKAEDAVRFVLPSVMELMKQGTFKREQLHIVVCQPALPHDQSMGFDAWKTAGVLYEYSIGDVSQRKKRYDLLAQRKCYLAWRCRMPTRSVLSERPYLLRPDDSVYPGGVYDAGLAVGVSGVEDHFDHMIAQWILEALRALCIAQAKTLNDAFPNGIIEKDRA